MNGFAPETAAPTCRTVKAGASFLGKQGLEYNVAISAETVGSQGLHMQLVTIAPGGRARAHKHSTHETAIYALTGTSCMWYGEGLEHHAVIEPGNFLYIPADMPHLPYNPSATEPVVAVIARTDPNEQESVVLLAELDEIHPA
jgi:uncharacterized RmlC-like cupin family protein